MTELQKKLLQLMTEMDEICRKYDIEYVLFAGTALGADRHRGFIPWDDDADIIMTLPNYEKLLSVMGQELKPGRAFDALEWDTDYMLTYARYVNTDTTAIQRHTLFGGCHPGIKLDIFCVVPASADEEKTAKHREDILAFAEVVCTAGRMMTYRPEGFYPRYLEEVKEAEALGREAYIKKHLEELKTRGEADQGDKCILFSGMASNTKLYDADIFDDIVYVPYENTKLPISAKNVKFSEQHLGRDWMALPADITEPRHLFLLDTERPCADYLEAAARKMDLAACEKAAISKKQNNLFEKEEFRDVLKCSQQIRNAAAALDTEKNLKKISKDASGQETASSAELLKAVRPLVIAQLGRSSKTHKLRVGVSDETLVRVLKILMKGGRYYDADNIIRVAGESVKDAAAKAEIEKIREEAEHLRSAEELLYLKKDYGAAKDILSAHPELGGSVSAKAADIMIRLEKGEDAKSLSDETDVYVKEDGNIGELLAVKGLCLEKAGDKDAAEETFKEAMKSIRNGFLYQEMVDRGISTDILFEAAKEADADKRKIKISDVMKGRLKGDKELTDAIKKSGAASLANKLRYMRYSGWVRNTKRLADKAFKEYESQLFNLTVE